MRNDVYNNRFNIPVIHSLDPIYETLMEDPVRIYVMANTVLIGHIGLVIGEGEDAWLYDPAGSYTGCKENKCDGSIITKRGSGDFFEYPDFNWDDYLDYHRQDGESVVVIEFIIPKEQAKLLKEIILEHGGGGIADCASQVAAVLQASGGIFKNLGTGFRTPIGLKHELIEFHHKKGLLPYALFVPNAY
ncbi:hypothetical protein AB7Y49_05615 [Providencia vermicola]|uniref:Uncharacterized protein n=2 Tax=Providencia TaxID=586 RepID=A0AAI9HVS2_PROST|nr:MULTISPECIES: hypothetical protein [Providencia]ELR5033872.1 hypothetical protein [Providencia stuartii]ELX8378005.1 hypothetical protein [Providencia stuartii]EMD5259555.1 hypothetical protein [Providencia stuartii]USB35985.1 hypothetical protein M5J11_14355 [Providencia vermicola]WFC05183.1 hypothetical protein PG365_10540 [Providencia vermicola]